VITPYEAGKDITAHIMFCLESMSETDAQVETELLLPTFKVQCAFEDEHLGLAVNE
jgi:hypothetical protein